MLVSNLELQRILYLTHINYLDYTNIGLLELYIEEYRYGKVIKPIYDKYKVKGSKKITEYKTVRLSSLMGFIVNRAIEEYKSESPYTLKN